MATKPSLFAQQLSSILWFANCEVEGGLEFALAQLRSTCEFGVVRLGAADQELAKAVIEKIDGGDDDENDDDRFDRLGEIGRLLPVMDITPA